MSITYLYDIDPNAVRIYRPLPWQLAGLQETASGYGKRLTSAYCVRLSNGWIRRIRVTQFSNAGTSWITLNGQSFVVVDNRIAEEK
jgi:hypothetical protein